MPEPELKGLKIIGLGYKGVDDLTLKAYKELKKVDKLLVRTDKHPVIPHFKEEGIDVISFDNLLEKDLDSDQIVNSIAEQIRGYLDKNIEVDYAVPGSPLVGDESVNRLVAKLPDDRIEVLPGLDSFGLLKRKFNFDSNGLQIMDSLAFRVEDIDTDQSLVLTNISNQKAASRLQEGLLEVYPADYSIQIIEVGKDYLTESRKLLLRNLDKLKEVDQLINLYIPALSEKTEVDLDRLGSLDTLVKVVAKLRSPEGCPWDLEQTHYSLRPHLIEETYEVLESIELNDSAGLCEELGDLLLHVVFHAQLAEETGDFTIEDVISSISEKMIRRHPHVFGTKELSTSDEVIKKWEEIKATEKNHKENESLLDITRGLPALMGAQEIQSKAAEIGFDWTDIDGAVDKLKEELEEFQEALMFEQKDLVKEELGDLLFAVVNVSRFLDLDSELTLHDACCKFKARFQYMEKLADDKLSGMSLTELEELWQKAKVKLEEEKINERFE
ncbi:nucleoside triphosphate pyrophosphohydrolase [Acetohalobium arabaticum]|uniref:MazG family protein n=1 Tax=Acetohalobium arabaticum (strain ATCC 49924 / DSM 5501 / Z-7288) TaxID=574087 RepID=D9QSV8_ACEAZ|nr:nucleoside triphosphate pyrophosphohydrolase [Acetohalobium arabaticum]ADL11646.1 MazG family protein [Acetohalobium arabaticum DSM 5501]